MKISLFRDPESKNTKVQEPNPLEAKHCHFEKGNPEDENNMYYLLQNYKPALGGYWERAKEYIDFYCFQGVCYNVTSK